MRTNYPQRRRKQVASRQATKKEGSKKTKPKLTKTNARAALKERNRLLPALLRMIRDLRPAATHSRLRAIIPPWRTESRLSPRTPASCDLGRGRTNKQPVPVQLRFRLSRCRTGAPTERSDRQSCRKIKRHIRPVTRPLGVAGDSTVTLFEINTRNSAISQSVFNFCSLGNVWS